MLRVPWHAVKMRVINIYIHIFNYATFGPLLSATGVKRYLIESILLQNVSSVFSSPRCFGSARLRCKKKKKQASLRFSRRLVNDFLHSCRTRWLWAGPPSSRFATCRSAHAYGSLPAGGAVVLWIAVWGESGCRDPGVERGGIDHHFGLVECVNLVSVRLTSLSCHVWGCAQKPLCFLSVSLVDWTVSSVCKNCFLFTFYDVKKVFFLIKSLCVFQFVGSIQTNVFVLTVHWLCLPQGFHPLLHSIPDVSLFSSHEKLEWEGNSCVLPSREGWRQVCVYVRGSILFISWLFFFACQMQHVFNTRLIWMAGKV